LQQIDSSDYPVLITEYNDLGNQRFYDPRTKQSFKYDHLRKEAQDYEPYETDPTAEPWRLALQEEIFAYTQSHYRHGSCSVFAKSQGGKVLA
jgi:capping protein alpha